MKKYVAFLMVMGFSFSSITASASDADRHNLTSNALGGLLGLFNLEYSYRFTDHATLGITGSNGSARLFDYELNGSSYGMIARYYLLPAFDKSSWYLAAAVEKKNFEVRTRKDGVDYSGKVKDTYGSVGAGYHWFWDSFNISFGVLATNQPNTELADSSGQKYKDTLDSRLNLDFTIGGKF